MAPRNDQAAPQSAGNSTSKPIASGASDPKDQAKHERPRKEKRKRRAADAVDASERATKRPRKTRTAMLTGQVYTRAATKAAAPPPTPVSNHPYAPTAPRATAPTSTTVAGHAPKKPQNRTVHRLLPVFEHPYAPTAPNATSHTHSSTNYVAYATDYTTPFLNAPRGSIYR